MIEVRAETDIDAPPAAVWRVLTDLPRFAKWNPFIREASGSAELGGTIHVRVQPSLRIPLAFRAKVTVRDDHELRWKGHVLADWLAAGDHVFEVTALPNGRSHFVQVERFSGLLPRLAKRLLATEAKRGFDAMNEALAREAAA
jgi:hypothetical protein